MRVAKIIMIVVIVLICQSAAYSIEVIMPAPEPYPITVNISPGVIEQPGLVFNNTVDIGGELVHQGGVLYNVKLNTTGSTNLTNRTLRFTGGNLTLIPNQSPNPNGVMTSLTKAEQEDAEMPPMTIQVTTKPVPSPDNPVPPDDAMQASSVKPFGALKSVPAKMMQKLNKEEISVEEAEQASENIYTVKGRKTVKLFGIIKKEIPVVLKYDAENDEITDVEAPWWRIFFWG
ncbi:hypothetical protein ACFL6I_09260 [candidate division KSB1 bacterium]